MAANILDEMLEGMARVSEEINARMINEKRDEDEILQEMEDQAFENIWRIIEEEMRKNQIITYGEKYFFVAQINEAYNTAARINGKKLAICYGERKSA
ncbi:MAG: hypothetical protein LBG95_03025 [Treponema sp.]|jgi:transcriptional regulator of heat shock response|nr:hypothetical protein [Treponema sp.]